MEVSGFVGIEEKGVGGVGHRAGRVGHVDVAELEVPESGDGDQEVPRQHGTHAQVAEDDAIGKGEKVLLTNISGIRFSHKVWRLIDFSENYEP